jgi:hypothetical protein
MPQTPTTKSKATESERLAYLELISTTLIGLDNAIKDLELRRAFAGLDETREINIKISEYQAELAKVTAARNLYLAQDVTFKPPSRADMDAAKNSVDRLDSIIVANEKAAAIIDAATNLISIFESTQV